MKSLSFQIKSPQFYVVKTTMNDMPVIIQSKDGYRAGVYNGEMWRVCTDDYCFTAMFPTKEAAEMNIPSPIAFRWLGGSGE